MKRYSAILALLLAAALLLGGCVQTNPAGPSSGTETTAATTVTTTVATGTGQETTTAPAATRPTTEPTDPGEWPGADVPYVVLGDNVPDFTDADGGETSYERYSDLDQQGRCGVAMACIGRDLMPTEERGSIGQVKPSGWQTVKYDFVDGKYLYNRCHLIGYQLSGENANVKNLITGTRYLNVEGMLPFENMVADYVKETGNHVLYRVTPLFVGRELVARGVRMEAWSVEDDGDGVCFDVFCFNVQPGVVIDYSTGSSREEKGGTVATTTTTTTKQTTTTTKKTTTTTKKTTTTTAATRATSAARKYVLNTSTKKFHLPGCRDVDKIIAENYREVTEERDELIRSGYSPCGHCKP